jgi:formylmethanofuran dehydrogenase subunit E
MFGISGLSGSGALNFFYYRISNMTVCGFSIADFLGKIEAFHGWKAPGLILGGFMVDWAQEQIGSDVEADAIVETRYCLPDAVQLFTPCTIGNGWLKVIDWDKFALSLYDRRELTGVRIRFDLDKTQKFPNLYNWFMRRIPKKQLPLNVLVKDILHAKRSVLSSQRIRVTRFYERIKKGDMKICPGCSEAFPTLQGTQCLMCQGSGYFELR